MLRIFFSGNYWIAGLLAVWSTAAFAAHPLITEDTGTQGEGRHQIEFTTERVRDSVNGESAHDTLFNLVWAYGFSDQADLLVTLPYHRNRAESDGQVSSARGIGDIGLDVKWRFYENGPFSIAIKPGLTAANGDDSRGLGAGRSNYSVYLVSTLDFEQWAFHLHTGYLSNRNTVDEREHRRHYSVAATRRFGDRLRIVADVGKTTRVTRDPSRDPAFAILGLIYAITDDVDIDIGYKKGISSTEADRTLLAGLAFRF